MLIRQILRKRIVTVLYYLRDILLLDITLHWQIEDFSRWKI